MEITIVANLYYVHILAKQPRERDEKIAELQMENVRNAIHCSKFILMDLRDLIGI